MGKLFSAFSLIDENMTCTIPVTNPAGYKDDSFFIEGLNFLTGLRKDYTYATATLYKNISEASTDRIAVREVFSDFFGTIKSFIKKIIDFIKKMLSKFWVRMNGMFLRDKYIESHKSELSKFETKHEFDIKGYTYTFTDNVPSTEILTTLSNSISDFSNEKNEAKNTNELKKAYDAFINKKNSNSYLDDIRAKCIGAKSNIGESDFKDELFKIFRNGDSTKSKITVTAAIVTEALAFFTNYDKLKNQTQRYSDSVEKQYKEIQKKLENVEKTTVNGTDQVTIEDILDNDTSADKIALYDLFMKAKSQEIQEISNMHVLAFTAKLDAIKEDFTQSKGILYGAFKKILAKNEETDLYNDLYGTDGEDDSDIDDFMDESVMDNFSDFARQLKNRVHKCKPFKAFVKGKSEDEKKAIDKKIDDNAKKVWLKTKEKKKDQWAHFGEKMVWAFAVGATLALIGIQVTPLVAVAAGIGVDQGVNYKYRHESVDLEFLIEEVNEDFFTKAD